MPKLRHAFKHISGLTGEELEAELQSILRSASEGFTRASRRIEEAVDKHRASGPEQEQEPEPREPLPSPGELHRRSVSYRLALQEVQGVLNCNPQDENHFQLARRIYSAQARLMLALDTEAKAKKEEK